MTARILGPVVPTVLWSSDSRAGQGQDRDRVAFAGSSPAIAHRDSPGVQHIEQRQQRREVIRFAAGRRGR